MSSYPEGCIQSLTPGDWWTKTERPSLEFGALVSLHVPFFDIIPYRLTARRSDPNSHGTATVVAEPLNTSKYQDRDTSALPVAGLPRLDGAHGWMLNRMKKRPCLVVGEASALKVDTQLTRGMSKSATHNYALVAPYYGVDQDARSGYNPAFVEKIKHATFSQWFWDRLPGGSASESILRLDQIHPAGDHWQAFSHSGFVLGEGAKKVFKEWLEWHIKLNQGPTVQAFQDVISAFTV